MINFSNNKTVKRLSLSIMIETVVNFLQRLPTSILTQCIEVIDNEIAKHIESLKTYYRTKGVGINLSAHNIITPLGFEVSPALKVDRDDLGWRDKQQVHVGMIRMYFIK